MKQKEQLQMVQFGVAGIEDIRTLMKRWQKVMAGLAKEEGPAAVWRTYLPVRVGVEDRRPGEEVLLTFLAPRVALERFLAELRNQGLEVCEEPLIPGYVLICRLGVRRLQ